MYITRMPKLNIDHEIKFWSRVIRTTKEQCWPYIGRLQDGYGRFDYGKKGILAHRLSYYFHYKIDPVAQLVIHNCDNPPCCNPYHLELGSSYDNVIDSVNKGRHSSVNLKGEHRPNSKLTEKKVLEIRYKRTLGYTYEALAEQYDIDYTTIAQVVRRQTWRHI